MKCWIAAKSKKESVRQLIGRDQMDAEREEKRESKKLLLGCK